MQQHGYSDSLAASGGLWLFMFENENELIQSLFGCLLFTWTDGVSMYVCVCVCFQIALAVVET